MTTTPTTAPNQSPRGETLSGMLISLGFWFTLLFAAILFAAVAISPKLLNYISLRSDYQTKQSQLLSLDQTTLQLQRVIDAIQQDKQFASELTRAELDAARPGEEVLPVELPLKLDAKSDSAKPEELAAFHPWYEPFVRQLASDDRLRLMLLGLAAAQVIFAFTSLQPASETLGQPHARDDRSVWRSLRNRYVRQA